MFNLLNMLTFNYKTDFMHLIRINIKDTLTSDTFIHK